MDIHAGMHVLDSVVHDGDRLEIGGWCFRQGATVVGVRFEDRDGGSFDLSGFGQSSDDVAAFFGQEHRNVRFAFSMRSRSGAGRLAFAFSDGASLVEQIDAKRSAPRIWPERHRFDFGRYRGAFLVAEVKRIVEVTLSRGGGIGSKTLASSDFHQEPVEGAVRLTVEVDALPEWTPDTVTLELLCDDGEMLSVSNMQMLAISNDPAHRISGTFLSWINRHAQALRVLEIGSRARSGIVRKAQIDQRHSYVGLDIQAGENVDVVCDAHEMSQHLEQDSFDAVLGYSVFEHLSMPWKAALELNRVMKVGGRAMFLTHQTWPLHEAPFDFWRFSADTWPSIFNAASGFRILTAANGQPAQIYPEVQFSGIADFGGAHGYLATSVLVEKIGTSALRWDVPSEAVHAGAYPK